MQDDETATAMCGRAKHTSDRGDQDEAANIYGLALAKAEDVHGPDGMIVGLVLRSMMIFQERADRTEDAAKTRERLDTILKKYGLAHPPVALPPTPLPKGPLTNSPQLNSASPGYSKLKIVSADVERD